MTIAVNVPVVRRRQSPVMSASTANEVTDTPTATPAGRMMVQMLAVFAEFEREMIIDRVINGMERKAAKGQWCGGYRPHGYDLDQDTGYLAVVDGEVAVVRRIFHEYTHDNIGSKAIATRLNAAGHRTKTGKPWSGNTVLVVLRNRVYLGEVFYRDRWHRGKEHHPPIVDEETFTQSERILLARGEDQVHHAHAASDYPLAGLIVCERCGKRYIGTAAHGSRYRYRYYTCYTRHRYGPGHCSAERLPADQLEEGVLASLLETLTRTDLIEAAVTGAHDAAATNRQRHVEELAAVETELVKTNDTIDHYLDAFERRTMPETSCGPRINALAAKARQLANRRDELTTYLEAEGGRPAAGTPDATICRTLHAHIQEILNTDSPGTTRELIQTLTHDIRVTGRDHIKPTFRVPTNSLQQLTDQQHTGSTETITGGKVRPPTRLAPPARQHTNNSPALMGPEVSLPPIYSRGKK